MTDREAPPGSGAAADWRRYPNRDAINIARAVVNGVLDQTGLDVKTRQSINDECDHLAYRLIAQVLHQSREDIEQHRRDAWRQGWAAAQHSPMTSPYPEDGP